MIADIVQERKNRSLSATEKQRKASNPDKSVWVEASAGTGKTKVLSDRVLRLLLKGVAPAKILCLTYTKAAAVEMNTRIAGRLSRWSVADEESLKSELEKLSGRKLLDNEQDKKLQATARKLFAVLLDTPGGMKIQTIHSFCQEVLKRFPLEAKISPYFEVMDDRAANEVLEEVKQRLIQKIEQNPQSMAAQSLALITGKVSEFVFPKIMNNIADNRNKISRLLAKYNSLEELIKQTAEELGVAENDTSFGVVKDFCANLDKNKIKRVMEALFNGSSSDVKRAEILAEFLAESEAEKLYAEYKNIFLTGAEIRKKLATKGAIAFDNQVVEIMTSLAEDLINNENKIRATSLLETTKAVLYLAEDLIKGYNYYKHLHSKMDYEDLIVLTRNLLEDKNVVDWVLFKLDGGIDNVLIDEAQDTSPDQWAIVKAITEDFFDGQSANNNVRTVFAVGDRKQSIYSFQGADPEKFESMRKYFARRMQNSGNFEEVQLDVSFRSTAAILDLVNNVFAKFPAKEGVVAEGQNMLHVPSRIGDGGKIELWPLIEAEEGENPEIYLPPVERKIAGSTSSRLAKQIAMRIKKMVDSGEKLVSQNRPIKYSDFMVLVQRRNSFVEELVRECKNVGVNIAGVDKIKLLEQIAVQDLVAVAKFVLLPTDDLTLATILKSPLFGLNDEDLFKICYNRGGASVWSKLGDLPEYAEVYQALQELLNLVDFVRPFEFYAHILTKMQGWKKMVARLGDEAIDGIDEFVNLTLNFEQEHIPTLQAFVDWIAEDEVEIKRELEQSDINAVRIMTAHGSKGLQAPIVILPDTVRVKDIKNEAGLLWGNDVMYYPLGSDNYEDNCKAIKEKEKQLSLEEYRRLLYVALTRAEDRLCICGYVKKKNPNEESWYSICQQSCAEIGSKDKEGNWCYEIKQQLETKSKNKPKAAKLVVPDYEWMHKNAESESPLAKPFTPSKPEEEDSEEIWASPISADGKSRYRRGLIIHKLLQFLPENKSGNYASVMQEFLDKNAAELSVEEKNRIIEEVGSLLKNKEFAMVFSENSRAEVPIMGCVGNKIISGQIDRLVVADNRVMIVDYKTNRPAAKTEADVPNIYVKQLGAYKSLIAEIYPDKVIETYILWTDTACLMKIDS